MDYETLTNEDLFKEYERLLKLMRILEDEIQKTKNRNIDPSSNHKRDEIK
jgi:hypothetical protein